jgi:hypothetical protein
VIGSAVTDRIAYSSCALRHSNASNRRARSSPTSKIVPRTGAGARDLLARAARLRRVLRAGVMGSAASTASDDALSQFVVAGGRCDAVARGGDRDR